jgi:hypothetical protein
MQQCFRLGKDNTHTKRPIKVVFKTRHEEVRDGLIGGSLMLSQVNKEQRTLFRIQEDLTMNQQKLYRNAWAEAGKRSKSGDEEEWTVVGPKSQPRLLLKRRLDEGKRGKSWRRRSWQRSFRLHYKTTWSWWQQKGHKRFRMLRMLSERNVMPLEIRGEGGGRCCNV